jgi:hypothetical protein
MLEHGRPRRAIEVLDVHRNEQKAPVDTELVAKALEQAISTEMSEPIDSGWSHHVARLLDHLESAGFDENRLALLEWAYMPLFRFESRHSGVLHRALATDPKFFVQIASLAYRARGEEPTPLSEETQARAQTAHDLLESWRIVPGTLDDRMIDRAALGHWVSEARQLLSESGRLEVGDTLIGQVLYYGPRTPGALWPAEEIREIIEQAASVHLENGFRVEAYNSRGVMLRGLTEGGMQDRLLAEEYRKHATSAAVSWPRTSALLKRIAKSFEQDARRQDADAALTEDLWR